MRNIKFRGKSVLEEHQLNNYGIKNKNRWVEGNLIQNENNPWIVGNVVEADWEYLAHEFWVEVESKTVGQYTGFKDKNSKEIYEGDILEKSNYWKIRIEYEDGVFWVRDADGVRYANKILEIPIAMFNLDEWEIIGNIYENPDLLK